MQEPTLDLQISCENWPISGVFNIARGAKTHAQVVVATLARGDFSGAGECVPYARYGESIESVRAQIESVRAALTAGADRLDLQELLKPGAARNALDCAFWALDAARTQRPIHELIGLSAPKPVSTCFTLSLDMPAAMGAAAKLYAHYPLLKIKLGTEDDSERIRAVRQNAPNARLIVDANEGWRAKNFIANVSACAQAGVELIEQPLPAGDDTALADLSSPIALCADESVHDSASLKNLPPWYSAINIKLDKTGGLTDALRLREAARARGLKIMVGCMVGTSLAMRPAFLLVENADYVDLDGPLLLAKDREPSLIYREGVAYP